ncbi:MAG: hypothetical protein LUC33_02685 [Prevotellaceae bacterium]|nr:hypothetical protein [Prevotellaceae bacterium]
MCRPDYRIYPSLLDGFQRLLDADADEERLEDAVPGALAAERERELIDSVNRVPRPATEAQARGTCLNEAVDCLIAGRGTLRNDMTLFSEEAVDGSRVIHAEMEGFTFHYDAGLVRRIAARFGPDAVAQHLCRGLIRTDAGLVELYGYADEIVRDKVYDIKATGSYQFGKYERGWQKLVYPYCLVESGEMRNVRSFEYTAVALRGGTPRCPVIGGEIYAEEYTYDHGYAEDRLRGMLGGFIAWLEAHREQITDRKIFGGENNETD